MIQDIYPSKFDNSFKNIKPQAGDRVISFRGEELLTAVDPETNELSFPDWSLFDQDTKRIYIFSIDEQRCFMAFGAESEPEGFGFHPMAELRRLKMASNLSMFAAFSAYHLHKWYAASRYCGACGAENGFDGRERAMRCPRCGNIIFPRINPAVIIAVRNGDRLLLTKYNRGYANWALVAGFTEFGETLEETVQREVMEEVGLKVKNIRYYKSQPWGIALDLLVGFVCDVDGDDTIHVDNQELKQAEWIPREEIQLQPLKISLTGEMMQMFKEGKL